MAWITPKTDRRGPEPRTTYVDMNRISNNVKELSGQTIKTNYTADDVVLWSDWHKIIDFVRLYDPTITELSDWQNLNKIERSLELAHDGTNIPSATLYPSESLYPR